MAFLDGEAPAPLGRRKPTGNVSGCVTAAEAEEFGISTRKRVNRWAWRRTLAIAGHRKGVPVYRVRDIRELDRRAAGDSRSAERRDS